MFDSVGKQRWASASRASLAARRAGARGARPARSRDLDGGATGNPSVHADDFVVCRRPAVWAGLPRVEETVALGVLLGEREGPTGAAGVELALEALALPRQRGAGAAHFRVGQQRGADVALDRGRGL